MFDWIFGVSSVLAEEGGAAADLAATASASPLPEGSMGAALATTFVPLILMVVLFYFFLIRPQRKKDKKVKEMLAALKPGDRVTTIGGIYGTIVAVKDDTITLAVGGQRTEMVFTRWAIRQVEEVTVENDGEILA